MSSSSRASVSITCDIAPGFQPALAAIAWPTSSASFSCPRLYEASASAPGALPTKDTALESVGLTMPTAADPIPVAIAIGAKGTRRTRSFW